MMKLQHFMLTKVMIHCTKMITTELGPPLWASVERRATALACLPSHVAPSSAQPPFRSWGLCGDFQRQALSISPHSARRGSPRNARRVGHSAHVIEARAASIQAKGVLQPLVVEPEVRADGASTGYYLVSIGEGRRQALRLLAKRKLLPMSASGAVRHTPRGSGA